MKTTDLASEDDQRQHGRLLWKEEQDHRSLAMQKMKASGP